MAHLLCACTAMNTVIQTGRAAMKSSSPQDSTRLNPAYRYLRITINGRIVFVTLGDIDKHSDGSTEVYYSGGSEVFRLQNGRVAGVVGLTTEWRNVSQREAPDWW